MRTPNEPYQFIATELPDSFSSKLIRTDVFSFEDKEYEYGILDPSVAPVHYAVGMPNGQNLIAAGDIPAELLPFYLSHEIQCNRFRADQVGRCASIEEEMLQTVPAAILEVLLTARLQTFEGLVTFYKIDVEQPANPFLAEIAGTTTFLRTKMRELGL